MKNLNNIQISPSINIKPTVLDSISQSSSIEQSYKELQFQYRNLEHQYAILDNEYQLYTSQTYERINQLEKQMDMIVEDKDRNILAIGQENAAIKQDNAKLQAEISGLQVDLDKLNWKIKANETELKSMLFNHERSEMRQRQIVLNFERELSLKIDQVENLKDILNNERMAVLSKDQLLLNKDNHIAELMAELKSLNIELGTQREMEDSIRESNLRLKREIEDLNLMFHEMESGLRICDRCRFLEQQNAELQAIVRGSKQRQRFLEKENRKDRSFSLNKNRRRTDYQGIESYNTISYDQGRRYLDNLTIEDIRSTDFVARSMKDSVMRRCKIALDRN